jgi:hypothetical protein
MKRFVLLALLAACAARGSAKVETAPPPEPAEGGEKQPDLDRSLSALPTPENEPTVVAPPADDNLGANPYSGSIDRAGLIAIVDQGLGRFFGHLRLAPVMDGKRFVGFAVAGIDPAWGDIGLRPGDIIQRVNGQVIERPEQAMAAFESLRVASEVMVEITRAGVPATLRFRIE